MKVLLVGNIANNSYNNAKILRRKGIEADVLCYSYTHIMGQPEWEDADFVGQVDQFFPDWNKVDLRGFKRPEWFFQETPIPIISKRYTLLGSLFFSIAGFFPIKKLVRRNAPRLQSFNRKIGLSKKMPLPLKRFMKSFFYQCYHEEPGKIKYEMVSVDSRQETEKMLQEQHLIEEFRRFFPWREDRLTKRDLTSYIDSLAWFRNIFKKYDIIHACSTDPIYAMLATPKTPYVAFEHGTLRDLPFEKNAQGRLLSLAYCKAKTVIITNPDTISSAKKLGLKNYVFIPHPLDETRYAPKPTPLHQELREKYHVDYVLFCPVRHDWAIKGVDMVIKGFAKYIKEDYGKALLILTSWGLEIEKSKRLIADLGIKEKVLWVPVLNESKHIHYLNAADIVLDQMIHPSFGGVAFKGMSCGKPVITSFRYELNKWCLEESPPLVSAFNEEDSYKKIRELLDSEAYRKEVGRKGREWIIKYHSWGLVTDKLIAVYKEALGSKGGK